jgi:hypothetical protein
MRSSQVWTIHPSAWKGCSRKFGPLHGNPVVGVRCSQIPTRRKRRPAIDAQAKSDGLRLLRAIDATQARGQEGARVDPPRAAYEAGLVVGDGSDRYQRALHYLIEEAALLGDENTAFDVGEEHPHGYALYFFTRRAVKLLEE